MKEKALLQFKKINEYIHYGVWAISTLSVFGSLYFSEIMNLAPCKLCWWQRIFMYPIAVIMSVAILKKDKKAFMYVLPLSILGSLLAFYHTLLQAGVIKETLISCTIDGAVSCAKKQINWFGFMTIPFMSMVAFLGITALCGIWFYNQKTSAEVTKK
jgi:disulfide bond formation protein DsbB